MAAFATLHGVHVSLLRSQFLGHDNYHCTHHHFPLKQPSTSHHRKQNSELHAKFNLMEIMGGRGLCNGEKGLQQELERQVVVADDQTPPTPTTPTPESASSGEEQEQFNSSDGSVAVAEDAFEKEMMGLTGGFPGGEKGLRKFIEENPPPKRETVPNPSL